MVEHILDVKVTNNRGSYMDATKDDMKKYRVFLTDLAAPLTGQNPRGGKTEYFDYLSAAQNFAESEKGNWHRVCIDQRTGDGKFERLEHYQKGRKYPGNSVVNED
jgi:hypothetical protein